MACDRPELHDYLANFTGMDPIEAVRCPFVQDAGAGLGLPLFSLFFFGMVGLGLSIRVQHPGPVVVAMMLSAALVAGTLPGIAAKVLALVLFFAIAAVGMIIYSRAKRTL